MRLRGVFVTLLSTLLSANVVKSAVVGNFADLPPNTSYDFIVVGGGTAGNVIASRLSEDPSVKVLVLEAGTSNQGVLNSQVPFLRPNLQFQPNPLQWNYTTVPQDGVSNHTYNYWRGYILGGSSSTNWLLYSRGSAEDYNRYASVTGDSTWSWDSILQYFKKSELFNPPSDNHNITGQFEPSVHGFNGSVGVSLTGHLFQNLNSRVFQAADELGGQFTFNTDYNSGTPIGTSYVQNTILNGTASSSATGYLSPDIMERPNLQILIGAQASRLLQTGNETLPAFRGVEFQTSEGTLRQLTATKEVILSAGCIGSPHILLNSGIGNADDLLAVGVNPIVNLTDVGANFSDHPVVSSSWLVNSTDTFETIRQNAEADLDVWENNRTGPYTVSVTSHVIFGRVSNASLSSPDPAAGPDSPHFEIAIINGGFDPTATGNFLSLGMILVSPASRGSIKLASNQPFDQPLINPGVFTDLEGGDLIRMRETIKSTLEYLAAPAWDNYIISSTNGLNSTLTDEELDEYITEHVALMVHGVGSASMSPKGASHGVVDPDHTVKKIRGVRVVDASVLPYVPSAHTVAPVYATAEKAADIIKAAYNLA